MKIKLTRKNEGVWFRAENGSGQTADIDGAEDIGGTGKGMRPAEMLLSSVGSCSAIDLVLILKKQRQPLEEIEVEVSGEREDHGRVRPFKAVKITFLLKGKIDTAKAERAARLAVEKYCPVILSLRDDIRVTHEVIIEK